MLPDFSPVNEGKMNILEFSKKLTAADLKAATNASIDTMLEIVRPLNDEQVAFLPIDPLADDPHAKPGEEKIGWSVAHLVVHVTASSEEWATYSSILARGLTYPAEPRLRYETEWTTVTTTAQCIQRLEESRRIRLGYLNAWPDHPNLDNQRTMSDNFVAKFGPMNAAACLLFGLKHEMGHFAQFRDAALQAQQAGQAAAAV